MSYRTIVHVLKGKANPNTMNGVNKVVHNLATAQLEDDYLVEVWGVTATPNIVRHNPLYKLRLFKAMVNRFALSVDMKAAIEAVPQDTLFHLHSVFLPELYAFSRELRRRGFKWVLTPHGGYSPEALKKNFLLKSVYRLFFENKVIEGASAIHAIGVHGEADQFGDVTSRKVGLVPNGCDLGDRWKKEWDSEGPLRLCFCGRLAITHKGLDLLLAAMRMTLDSGVDCRLDLIGDGEDRPALERLCKSLGLSEKIKFWGEKMSPEKEVIILQADCFVHASRWDGLPTAVLEAAALGLPLILSVPTNMAEYTHAAGAGYVIKVLSSACIKDAICAAAEDKRRQLLRPKGVAARTMISTGFSWSVISRRISAQVYSKVPGGI